MASVNLMDAEFKSLNGVNAAVNKARTPGVRELPVEISGPVNQVRARVAELFLQSLLDAGMTANAVDVSLKIPGRLGKGLPRNRIADLNERVQQLMPEDAVELAKALQDPRLSPLTLLPYFISVLSETGDARGMAELVSDLTAPPVAGVRLDKLPARGTSDAKGQLDIVDERFYKDAVDGVRARAVTAVTYARYQDLRSSIGNKTPLGLAFQQLVKAYYKAEKTVAPGAKFTKKSEYAKAQWLGNMFDHLAHIDVGNWQLAQWQTDIEACKTTDELVGVVDSLRKLRAPVQRKSATEAQQPNGAPENGGGIDIGASS